MDAAHHRGLIAFDVIAIGQASGSSVLPEMTVTIVDAVTDDGDGACEGVLTLLDGNGDGNGGVIGDGT